MYRRDQVLRGIVCGLVTFLWLGIGLAWAADSAEVEALKGTSWWGQVQEGIRGREYEITWQEKAGALHTANRAQNLRAHFREGVVELAPRTGDAAWRWSFELTGFGCEGSLAPVEATQPSARGNRVEYVRPAITEWYENSEKGIEQGFLISERPEGDGPVLLQGCLSGNLEARLEQGGGCVSFFKDAKEVLRYGKLIVQDAEGTVLSSRLTLEGDMLGLVIDDEGRYPIFVDPLFTSPSWMVEGDQADARFGHQVASAGDVNGDGYSDVIVGARTYDNGETDEGCAFVYHGGPSGLSSSPDWMVEGDQADAILGYSVSSAGDVDNDGYSDVIVGAPWYDNGQTDEGRAYVYHGGPSGLSSTPDWTAEGDQAGAWFGISVASAGDVNGDEYPDVIVGALYYDNGQTDEGGAFVYHGGPSGLSATPDWTAESDQTDARFGISVASAGDVNGDEYSDVIVGAYFYDNGQPDEGRAFVYHGGPPGLSATSDWMAESDQTGALFGVSVASAGDVNGDGYCDVIVAAFCYDSGQTNEGRAYVYHGGPSGLLSTPAWTAESDQTSAYFGGSVAGAGDVNNDGYHDVIVGAYQYDNPQTDEGRAYVYHGGPSGLLSTPAWTVESDRQNSYFGWSVASAGDVNGDGYPDIIVGADHYDNWQTDEGAAFLYLAPPPAITSVIDHPHDQGGKVLMTWTNSSLDVPPNQAVTHYTVWKRYQGGGVAAGRSGLGPLEPSRPKGVSPQLVADLTSYGWEYVSDCPAIYKTEHSMTVPTYADSTASGISYCGLMVVAHTEDPWTFWPSDPDSGYSVDNLPPDSPQGLAGQYLEGCQVLLHWSPNTEVDLSHYAIYRGTTPDFAPSEANLIGTATDTVFVDDGYGPESEFFYHYKVSVFDVNENESGHALLTPEEITGAPGIDRSYVNMLFQNVPNPFLTSTLIAFSMESAGHARLQVFDAKGRLVRVLADDMRGPSRYVEEWDGRDGSGQPVAAGIYFYRLEVPGWSAVKKLTLAK